jgi:flavin-dependent dehydrogenase
VRSPRRYGLRRHYRVPAWTDLVEVYWTPHAEVYVTPVADDLVGVAVLAARGVRHAQVVSDVPELAGRLRGAAPVAAVMGAGPLWQRARSVRHGRVLLAGDAAGYVDAITGEGIRVGLASARVAVEALAADQPESYPQLWSEETREFRWLTAGLVQGTRARPVRRLIVPAARRAPSVFGAAVERLAA